MTAAYNKLKPNQVLIGNWVEEKALFKTTGQHRCSKAPQGDDDSVYAVTSGAPPRDDTFQRAIRHDEDHTHNIARTDLGLDSADVRSAGWQTTNRAELAHPVTLGKVTGPSQPDPPPPPPPPPPQPPPLGSCSRTTNTSHPPTSSPFGRSTWPRRTSSTTTPP